MRAQNAMQAANRVQANNAAQANRMQSNNAMQATTLHRAQPDQSPEERSWHDQANCLGVDPDLFFPERGASTREAKEVCRGCVVREACLEYALSNGEKFGIWGGMSERERRRLRRARALARRGLGPTGVASA
jgi:WhiB family transcriptional regulator, redox-sensing transcriptional regulator